MNEIFNMFVELLGNIFLWCFNICKNYGISIVLFTILSKVVLFPINILIQKNSIKMVKMKPKIDELKMKYDKDKDAFMEAQIDLFEKEKYHPTVGAIPLILQIPIILGLVQVIGNPTNFINDITNTMFLGMDLSVIPIYPSDICMPILAAITTILLCLFQNRLNVLQREESIVSKLLTGLLTVILTVYFVFYVPNGVGLYWVLGNVLGIIQLYILNFIFPPKKYVDYNYLEKVKKARIEKETKEIIAKKQSKYYYKKFFEEENIERMKLLFYSEGSGFFKYYKGMIEYILNNSDITIHYVTSDINDKIFEYDNPNLIPYFIDTNRLIPLFMKLECDIVVMTTPELQNLYLKRSIIKKDIEYIFTDHGLGSVNLLYRPNALDYYDTVFAKNKKQEQEIRELEKQRQTKQKNIVQTGYTLIEDMIRDYEKKEMQRTNTVLIAPSWQEDNILDSCLDKLLEGLLKTQYKIIIRPHPQYIRRTPENIDALEEKYKEYLNDKIIIERDFSSNETVYSSDLIITDWSGIGYEFAFSTTKPVLFINTKMKILNPEYEKIPVIPMDIEVREKLGKCIEKSDVINSDKYVTELISNQSHYMEQNRKLREEYIFNLGNAAMIEGQYIINQIKGDKK